MRREGPLDMDHALWVYAIVLDMLLGPRWRDLAQPEHGPLLRDYIERGY